MIQRRTVGLYIRPSWVEAVELTGGPLGIRVARFGRLPLLSSDPAKITEGIRGVLDTAHIKARDVVVAIPSQEIFLRYFLLPAMPKSEWMNAVRFEARKYVPFKMEELTWDYCVMEQPATRQLGVVFVGVRKEVLSQYAACLRNAGVRPTTVEAASFSLARIMRRGRSADADKVTVIVDLNREDAHLALVKGSVPLLARDVSLVPATPELRTVEELVQAQAQAQAVGGERRLEQLLSELHLSFDYFAREFPNEAIGDMQIIGERPDDAWLETLRQEFHVPVAFGTSLQAIQGSATLQGSWTVPMGLALRTLTGREPRINLAQGDRATSGPAAIAGPFSWLAQVEAGLSVAALLLLFLALSQQSRQIHQQIDAVKQQKATLGLPMEGASLETLTAAREQLDTQLIALREVVRDRVPLTPKFSALPRLLPDGVWLNHLNFEYSDDGQGALTRTLTLEGLCYREEAGQQLELVSQLAQSLRNDAAVFTGFNKAELSSVKNVTLHRFAATSFQLRCFGEGRRVAP